MNYIFVPPKGVRQNEISCDAGHFIHTEIESTDFKKSNLASKMPSDKKQRSKRMSYKTSIVKLEKPVNAENIDTTETIETLEDIASLQPGKNSQLAAKKISEKYKNMREARARKNRFKIPGEIVTIETVKTP